MKLRQRRHRRSHRRHAENFLCGKQIPVEEAAAKLFELADEVVSRHGEVMLTRAGEPYVALVDVKRLDVWHALEQELEKLELPEAAREGGNGTAGMTEEETDRLLSEIPRRPKS
jgi:prevent-host-death family protein